MSISEKVAEPRILVFAGSRRADSLNRKLAQAAARALTRAGATVSYIELKDFPMPLYDGDFEISEGVPAAARSLGKLLRDADGFAIASPEYNGSFSPLVKNVIDWITRPEPGGQHSSAFRGKIAGLLSASPGGGGGHRGLRHLRELLENLRVGVISEQVIVPRALEAFDANGDLVREADVAALNEWTEKIVTAAREVAHAAA